MCGRAYSPDFMFIWPNARIGIMGGAQVNQNQTNSECAYNPVGFVISIVTEQSVLKKSKVIKMLD